MIQARCYVCASIKQMKSAERAGCGSTIERASAGAGRDASTDACEHPYAQSRQDRTPEQQRHPDQGRGIVTVIHERTEDKRCDGETDIEPRVDEAVYPAE